MRIGMAQMDISWENIEDNKKKVEEFFQKAVENQVDCIVFPEMTLTGFSMNVEETGEKAEKQVHFFEEMRIYRASTGGALERTSGLEPLL